MLSPLVACLWAATIRVEGDGRCPTAAAVQARLAPLVAAGEAERADEAPRVARLVENGTGITLRLIDGDGHRHGEEADG